MIAGYGQSTILACIAADWSPQIGDPDLTGWLTVGSYVICAVLALAVWLRRPDMAGRGLWAGIALLLMFLAINKQLDLQTALTATGRCLSHAQGWYEQRRVVQMGFILLLVGGVGFGLFAVMMAMRGRVRDHRLALIGLGLVCAFVLVRAVGFHFVDILIGRRLMGVNVNFLFENAGLVLIAINAIALLRGRGHIAPVPDADRPEVPLTQKPAPDPASMPQAPPKPPRHVAPFRGDKTIPPGERSLPPRRD